MDFVFGWRSATLLTAAAVLVPLAFALLVTFRNHRDLLDPDLLENAGEHVMGSKFPATPDTSIVIAQAA